MSKQIDLEKLRARASGLPDSDGAMGPTWCTPTEVLELLDRIASLEKDAARLMFACEFDGYATVDKDRYDYAIECAEENGREKPNSEDELNGLRRLIDTAMEASNAKAD